MSGTHQSRREEQSVPQPTLDAIVPGQRLVSGIKGSRPYPIHTKLGAIMNERQFRVIDVATGARINPRTMTEYLAGRLPIRAHHLPYLARFLEVDPEDLID